MINKPRCVKAQTKVRDMALFCNGEFLCAHQYYCPTTKRYENTPGFGTCKRLAPPVKPVEKTVAEAQTPEPVVKTSISEQAVLFTDTATVPTQRYTPEIAETANDETTNKEAGRSKINEGRTRKTGRRNRKKG